jgi:hypothetical protein
MAAVEQFGRRGIVHVRELVPLADALAESPMESEARLMMFDGGLPAPALQHEVVDAEGRVWRLDFAWLDQKVAVEYDGFDWHSDPVVFRRDRLKRASLRAVGWEVTSIVSDDVRRHPDKTVRMLRAELARSNAA